MIRAYASLQKNVFFIVKNPNDIQMTVWYSAPHHPPPTPLWSGIALADTWGRDYDD